MMTHPRPLWCTFHVTRQRTSVIIPDFISSLYERVYATSQPPRFFFPSKTSN
ncbi:hypothetical protein Mapa_001344 [Marchantia paleacea]|nr:hypothetical protein Mapa_001344 [Marchantia paleacea]